MRPAGCGTAAWNSAPRRTGAGASRSDFSRLLTRLKRTARYGWLRDTPSTVLTQKLRDQDRAFANFFAGRAKYPRFRNARPSRSASSSTSARCTAPLTPTTAAWCCTGAVEAEVVAPPALRRTDAPGCPGCPKPKMVETTRPVGGSCRSWWRRRCARRSGAQPRSGGRPVTDSGGGRVAPLRALQRRLRRLRRAQRVLSRRRRGSGPPSAGGWARPCGRRPRQLPASRVPGLVDENQAIVTETEGCSATAVWRSPMRVGRAGASDRLQGGVGGAGARAMLDFVWRSCGSTHAASSLLDQCALAGVAPPGQRQ